MLETSTWIDAYHQAWITRDAERVASLFTENAIYQSHPFRAPHQGRDEIRAYWRRATSAQEDLEVRWGIPIVSGSHMAIEWWATMNDTDEGKLTLPGCLFLRFAANGLCEELREYWHIELGQHVLPSATWGR